MTNTHQPGNPGADRSKRLHLFGIICLTLLGFYLRYRCLGCLGFRWDEDLTSLAVKTLLDKGIPELPSGMIYFRFYPYQWIIAAPVTWFGFSEFSMRLPAVFFGTALIPASYFVAARLFDRRTGLIVAACIALSFWQVEISRTARMYAPFFLIWLFAAYAIYRAHFQNTERLFSASVPLLALLALSIHQLAYSLAILLVLAIPLNMSLRRSAALLLQAAGIGIAFLAIKSVHQRFFNIPLDNAENMAAAANSGDSSGLIGAVLQQIALPYPELLLQLSGAYPMTLAAGAVVFVIAASVILRPVAANGGTYTGLVWLTVALALAQQFNLVILMLSILLIMLQNGLQGVRNPAWYRPAAVCLGVFLIWLITAAVVGTTMPADIPLATEGGRKLLRHLVDYPNFRLFWSFVLERPLMAIPLALGTLWGLDKVARKRPDPVALFVLGSFWLVVFTNGILETKFEFFRYNLHVDPFFLMLAVTGLFATPELLRSLGVISRRTETANGPRGAWVVAVTAIAILGVNPVAAVLTSSRSYSETSFPYALFGLANYEDFKTPAAYVSERLEDDDIILVLDPREYWNYIGRVNYWIRSSNYESQTYLKDGRAMDRYVGIPLLHNAAEMRETIAENRSGRVWILYSRERLNRTPWISDDIKTYLRGLEQQIAYVGKDGHTIVIELDGPGD